jgi:hypothetical protein
MLSRFHAAQRAAVEAKNQARRAGLAQEKSLLIQNGTITNRLREVLRVIVSWYGNERLDHLAASRLWYRCGLRLSHLAVLLETREFVTVNDFLIIIEKIVEEEESGDGTRKVDISEAMDTSPGADGEATSSITPTFEVGDKVEVAEGYEKYGDAASGPLKPGDRGSVMEVQRGPRGDRQSVRVVFNGRRWWYQPQALLSERSGLVESPAVRLIINILRSHGYSSMVEPIWGQPVTSETWKIGDLVVPVSSTAAGYKDDCGLGRIVADSSSHRRDSGLVTVDFASARGGPKRVKVGNLLHTTFYHGVSVLGAESQPDNEDGCVFQDAPSEEEEDDDSSSSPSPTVNATLLKNISGVSQLDKTAMTSLLKECKTSASLAGLFAAGLPDAILSGMDHACIRDCDATSLSVLGNLSVAVARQLFNSGDTTTATTTTTSSATTAISPSSPPVEENIATNGGDAEGDNTSHNSHSSRGRDFISNSVNVRDLIRDLGSGAEQRRGVLLALMASARMSDESSRGSEDGTMARGRNLLSSFGRLSAEAAAFGFSSSFPLQGGDESHSSPPPPPVELSPSPTTLLSSVLRGSSTTPSGSTQRRSISSSTKSLIHDGLLLNNPSWVKKALHAGADAKSARDDDDVPLLKLAISLGCVPTILSTLIKSGTPVTEDDLQTAALTNQPLALSLLLRHAVYTIGSIDTEQCTPAVLATLASATEKQRRQEETMRRAAGDFAAELLRKFVTLALKYRTEEKKAHAQHTSDTLVGDVLLHAMHYSQGNQAAASLGSEDGRIPAFHRAGVTNTPQSLLEALPESVIRLGLGEESSNNDDEALTTYLRLTEQYMWSKNMRDAAVGLTLAVTLLRKAPALCEEMARFGIKELAHHHVLLADEALADIALPESTPPVVKCPQRHTTILHLTRHSSFRCDLCGKGVEQNKPMHGCRECDWDACESCTDKAEGGLVKWGHIRNLAVEAGGMVDDEGEDTNDEGEQAELGMVCRAILERDVRAVELLRGMLDVPGRVTLFEFASCVLPSLYFAMVGERNGMRRNDVNLSRMKPTRRRCKKPRVGLRRRGKSSVVKRLGNEGGYLMDWSVFMAASVKALILKRDERVSNNALNRKDSDDVEESEVEPIAEMQMEGHDDADSDDNTEERNPNTKDKSAIPEVLRRLHTILAFYERVIVSQHNARNSEVKNGGELQSLLLPFEIEFQKSNHKASTADILRQSESGTDLTGSVVHVEPLMPIAELQRHILRTCRIPIPSYTRYCHRLALDRAIIAERPRFTLKQDEEESSKDCQRKIARVLEYHDATGAHLIQYASHLVHQGEETNVGEILRSGHCDSLEFNGPEVMFILAVRDYCILYRENNRNEGDFGVIDGLNEEEHTNSPGEFNFEGAQHANMAIDIGNVSPPTGRFSPPTKISSSRTTFLPTGTRVESDVSSNDNTQIYTIISSAPHNSEMESFDHQQHISDQSPFPPHDSSSPRYVLVSDHGEVILNVPGKKLRGYDAALRMHHQRENLRQNNSGTSHSSNPPPPLAQPQRSASAGEAGSGTSAILRGSSHGFFERGVPIASVRRVGPSGGDARPPPSTPAVGVLRRTWSALSPLQNMRPLELSISATEGTAGVINEEGSPSNDAARRLSMGAGDDLDISIDFSTVENGPHLSVEFSLYENLPPLSLPNPEETTLFSGLKRLHSSKKSKRRQNIALERRVKLFYTISLHTNTKNTPSWQKDVALPNSFTPPWTRHQYYPDAPNNSPWSPRIEYSSPHFAPPPFLLGNTSTNLNESRFESSDIMNENEMDVSMGTMSDTLPLNNDNSVHSPFRSYDVIVDPRSSLTKTDGLCETTIQCLELLSVLAEHSTTPFFPISQSQDSSSSSSSDNIIPPPIEADPTIFVSDALTSKLLEQLEDPLTVVGGALPEWCTITPAFAPRVFSHSSRHRLLERAAFGVSRAALRQQEAKVAVGPLRQRMAALRGRAVELVGEAFSGGAADPTALQLQADELYGMEEALAARVNAAFRAQRWDERSLQCAKAAVRRDELLSDASKIMERYASDSRVNRRRLEVRFEGESGFDAASGEEAGVTRGFYADVAEALLSCEHVCGTFYPGSICEKGIIGDTLSSRPAGDLGRKGGLVGQRVRLPLWIPDIDASGKVVIPTPRANAHSVPGVYPRPLSPHHPLHGAVLDQFRFMGRLFAAALRDGFIFPLPLSAAFLKLVQTGDGGTQCANTTIRSHTKNTSCLQQKHQRPSSSSNSSLASVDYFSNSNASVSSGSSSPTMKTNMSIDDFCPNISNSLENANPLNRTTGLNEPFRHNVDGNNSSFLLYMAAEQGGNVNPETAFSSTNSSSHQIAQFNTQLNSLDLPRPGFLGGEVYAVERYICEALDKLDETKFDLSDEELALRRQAIARDRSFARIALGKSYDCSFEEYFEDRCFVDPLDPTQGDDAAQLCTHGASRSVTIDNIREWTALAKQFFLRDGVIAQAKSFRQGVNDFFCADALRLFTAEELQRDVCGGGDNVDNWDEKIIRSLFKLDGGKGAAEALVAVAAMGGEGGAALSRRFGPSSPTVGYLVKALLGANSTQRRQFLSFVTSVPIVTPGQIEVVPVVNPAGEFLPMSDPGCLPRANTCARRLYLPKFESYDSFSQVIWAVVREESKFKGFYEWRG